MFPVRRRLVSDREREFPQKVTRKHRLAGGAAEVISGPPTLVLAGLRRGLRPTERVVVAPDPSGMSRRLSTYRIRS
jgi:hypothetical protein